MDRELLVCDCGLIEHQMVWQRFPEDQMVTVEFHLSSRGFLRRLWAGTKFIFGYRSRYGEFDDVVLNLEKVTRLKEFLVESEALMKAHPGAART